MSNNEHAQSESAQTETEETTGQANPTEGESGAEQSQSDAGDAKARVEEPTGGEAGEAPAGEEDELSVLQQELAAAKDAALRAQADAQNVQRRAAQDVEKARKFALERFAGELLPVVDNLERALAAAGTDVEESVKPIAEGVELTLKSFLDVLAKFNVDLVDPQGEPFDPNLHQAMTMIENPDVEPNTVIDVMQRGYTLNGRLIRPAMVVVSKSGD